MIVRVNPSFPTVMMACLGVAAAALVAGCARSPASLAASASAAAQESAAATQTPATEATEFGAFPVAQTWNPGAGAETYEAIFGPKSDSGKHIFGFPAEPYLVFWAACIGPGSIRLDSPAIGLTWNVACDSVAGDPAAIVFKPLKPVKPGQLVKIQITAGSTIRWEFRIDTPSTLVPTQAPTAAPA